MFSNWIQNLTQADTGSPESTVADLHKASAMLLLEVARADYDVSDEERAEVLKAIAQTSGLSADELQQIIAESEQQADQSISYHAHIRLINENLDKARKIQLIEHLWRVAFADNNLDRYEEAFIRKIADLIYIKHRDFIQAKLRVQSQQD